MMKIVAIVYITGKTKVLGYVPTLIPIVMGVGRNTIILVIYLKNDSRNPAFLWRYSTTNLEKDVLYFIGKR